VTYALIVKKGTGQCEAKEVMWASEDSGRRNLAPTNGTLGKAGSSRPSMAMLSASEASNITMVKQEWTSGEEMVRMDSHSLRSGHALRASQMASLALLAQNGKARLDKGNKK
jgi:hypothetical protein